MVKDENRRLKRLEGIWKIIFTDCGIECPPAVTLHHRFCGLKYFINFSPAISMKAATAIRRSSRRWSWLKRSDKQLEDLARMFNPIIQGWINYFGRYYKSALYPILKCLERRLIMWAARKYKRLRYHRRRAAQWLNRIARKQPYLFAHWKLLYANGWTIGAV